MIFKTHENSRNLIQTTRKVPTIVTLEGKTGFLSIQPIYSKGTREKIGYAQSFYELSSLSLKIIKNSVDALLMSCYNNEVVWMR
ncbi:hypothetical protein EfmJHP36_13310 [Enterococcus faecium]|nr:hypothetical protein EfmJHP36_13310 [Enterococcus faecium]